MLTEFPMLLISHSYKLHNMGNISVLPTLSLKEPSINWHGNPQTN
jgi:hypothetical protein